MTSVLYRHMPSAAWTTTRGVEAKSRLSERKVHEKIYGLVFNNVAEQKWVFRINARVYEMYKRKNLMQFVEGTSLEWAGLWNLRKSDEKNYDRRDERKNTKKKTVKKMEGRRWGATRRTRSRELIACNRNRNSNKNIFSLKIWHYKQEYTILILTTVIGFDPAVVYLFRPCSIAYTTHLKANKRREQVYFICGSTVSTKLYCSFTITVIKNKYSKSKTVVIRQSLVPRWAHSV